MLFHCLSIVWCALQDLNPDEFPHHGLNVARLPIPPSAQSGAVRVSRTPGLVRTKDALCRLSYDSEK